MRWSLVVLLLALALPAEADPLYPRLGNIYLHGFADTANLDMLARWDLLVLDTVWTEEQLAQLRARNPDILLYFYVNPYSVDWPAEATDAWELANTNYAAADDLWWYDRNAQPASDWPGSRMVNVTAMAPAGQQGSWCDYLVARIEALVAARPSLDGIMLDNFWQRLSWNQPNLQLDSDCNPTSNPSGCDGVADTAAALDSLWNRALHDLAANLRGRFDALQARRLRPLSLIGNGANDYHAWLNGSIHEAFPSGWSNVDAGNPYHYNWNFEMFDAASGYLVAPFSRQPLTATIMNSVWQGTQAAPDRSSEFERHKRFTFVSTLLGDGYYSLDAGQTLGNGALWWEPEYDHAGRGTAYLGRALGAATRIGTLSGPEEITNGTFAAGTSGWTAYPFGVVGDFSADQGEGQIRVQSVSPGGEFKVWGSQMSLRAGESYLLSLRARADRNMDVTLHLYGVACPGTACLGDRTLHLGPTWRTEEILFVAPVTASTNLDLFVRAAGTVWIDDVSLRAGDLSVYRREFERGTVLLNYTAMPQTIALGEPMTRLEIPGSAVFDGAEVSEEAVPPWDGRILLRSGVVSPEPQGVLHPSEPNPFNPSTRIRFDLLVPTSVSLSVLDARGRLVRVLHTGPLPAGANQGIVWDGTDRFAAPVRSGTYFVRLETTGGVKTQKMTLLR